MFLETQGIVLAIHRSTGGLCALDFVFADRASDTSGEWELNARYSIPMLRTKARMPGDNRHGRDANVSGLDQWRRSGCRDLGLGLGGLLHRFPICCLTLFDRLRERGPISARLDPRWSSRVRIAFSRPWLQVNRRLGRSRWRTR